MELNEIEFYKLKILPEVDKKVLMNKNHPKYPYVDSLRIITNNFKLITVKEILYFWKDKNLNQNYKFINDHNWMYFYCMKYGFLKNLKERNINICGVLKEDSKNNLSKLEAEQYLSSLIPEDENKIRLFFKSMPFSVRKDNNNINDGTHRCCSMIGRLIKNQKYIPMYITYI